MGLEQPFGCLGRKPRFCFLGDKRMHCLGTVLQRVFVCAKLKAAGFRRPIQGDEFPGIVQHADAVVQPEARAEGELVDMKELHKQPAFTGKPSALPLEAQCFDPLGKAPHDLCRVRTLELLCCALTLYHGAVFRADFDAVVGVSLWHPGCDSCLLACGLNPFSGHLGSYGKSQD
ncbi:hypothetical protein [Pelagibius marinus]|uniref:hypothetical protein n=1 Tax=Pelagibius marinus TaxID=2762760 RepID=UPI001872CA56|nr:hypothetical protein [Pelagibius marinus]